MYAVFSVQSNTVLHQYNVLCSEDVVRVRATVVEHNKLAKVIVFKKKRRKNYKKTKGKQALYLLLMSS